MSRHILNEHYRIDCSLKQQDSIFSEESVSPDKVKAYDNSGVTEIRKFERIEEWLDMNGVFIEEDPTLYLKKVKNSLSKSNQILQISSNLFLRRKAKKH